MGRKNLKTRFSSAFTLIELLVAIAIIGVLAGSLFFVLNPGEQLKKSSDARRKSDLYQIRNALDLYYGDYNRYPSSVSGKIQGTETQGIEWGGQWQPYMPTLPKDPISNQSYYYEAADDGSWYRLYAKLGRCSDTQVITGIDCNNASYNYSVTSTNVSVVAFSSSNSSVPTSAPAPTVPAATPTPAPALTFTPTQAPTLTPSPIPPTPTPTIIVASDEEHPLQDRGLTSQAAASGSDFNMGHKFTVNRNGKITQLWSNCDVGTRTARLYDINGNELRSVSITAQGQNNWVYGDITPINVTAGASYIVAIRNESSSYCYKAIGLPFTIGNITINVTGYSGNSSSVPSLWETHGVRGLVDITFIPTN